MKRYGSIYIITNLVTGKKYIGQTIQPVEKRFQQHATDSRSGRHMYSSIQFYGKQNFSIEEVMVCFDLKSLDYYETYFINELETFSPKGYNLCKGGMGKGIITEETRKKMSEAKIGKSVKRQKLWSEESRLNKSKSQGGKPICAKNVLTGEVTTYQYLQLACRQGGFYEKEIYSVLKGTAKIHKNHIFYYANQSGSLSDNTEKHAQRIEIEPAIAE